MTLIGPHPGLGYVVIERRSDRKLYRLAWTSAVPPQGREFRLLESGSKWDEFLKVWSCEPRYFSLPRVVLMGDDRAITEIP